jgi:hypothetical protein
LRNFNHLSFGNQFFLVIEGLTTEKKFNHPINSGLIFTIDLAIKNLGYSFIVIWVGFFSD